MSENQEIINNKCAFVSGGFVAPDTHVMVVVSVKDVVVFTATVKSVEPTGSPLEVIQTLADEFESELDDFEVRVFALHGEIHGRDLPKQ